MPDQTIGLLLALSSSLFIGASFVIKKRGLRRAGSTGVRAGVEVGWPMGVGRVGCTRVGGRGAPSYPSKGQQAAVVGHTSCAVATLVSSCKGSLRLCPFLVSC